LGIRRAYNIQKAKYFPMPYYNISNETYVEATVYGKTIDDSASYIKNKDFDEFLFTGDLKR
jgi:ATP-dependent DNA helicase RecG